MDIFMCAGSCIQAMALIASVYISQTQKSFLFEYLHAMDLICHEDSIFLGNYIGMVITIATWHFGDGIPCRLLQLRDTDLNIVPAYVCVVLQ